MRPVHADIRSRRRLVDLVRKRGPCRSRVAGAGERVAVLPEPAHRRHHQPTLAERLRSPHVNMRRPEQRRPTLIVERALEPIRLVGVTHITPALPVVIRPQVVDRRDSAVGAGVECVLVDGVCEAAIRPRALYRRIRRRIHAQSLSDVRVEHLARIEPDIVVGVDHELQMLVMVQPVRETLRVREEAVVPRVAAVALAVVRHRAVLLNVPAHVQDQRVQRQLAPLVLRKDRLRRRLVNPRLPILRVPDSVGAVVHHRDRPGHAHEVPHRCSVVLAVREDHPVAIVLRVRPLHAPAAAADPALALVEQSRAAVVVDGPAVARDEALRHAGGVPDRAVLRSGVAVEDIVAAVEVRLADRLRVKAGRQRRRRHLPCPVEGVAEATVAAAERCARGLVDVRASAGPAVVAGDAAAVHAARVVRAPGLVLATVEEGHAEGARPKARHRVRRGRGGGRGGRCARIVAQLHLGRADNQRAALRAVGEGRGDGAVEPGHAGAVLKGAARGPLGPQHGVGVDGDAHVAEADRVAGRPQPLAL